MFDILRILERRNKCTECLLEHLLPKASKSADPPGRACRSSRPSSNPLSLPSFLLAFFSPTFLLTYLPFLLTFILSFFLLFLFLSSEPPTPRWEVCFSPYVPPGDQLAALSRGRTSTELTFFDTNFSIDLFGHSFTS